MIALEVLRGRCRGAVRPNAVLRPIQQTALHDNQLNQADFEG